MIILRVRNAQEYQTGKEKQELQEGRVRQAEYTTRIEKRRVRQGKESNNYQRRESDRQKKARRPVRQAK